MDNFPANNNASSPIQSFPQTPSSTSSSPNRNHNFWIPLNSDTSPNPRTNILSNNPFGLRTHDDVHDFIPLNISSSSTTATTPTTFAELNSPSSPQTAFSYDRANRRNTNNANTNMTADENEDVFEVKLVLRHNAHDPFQPKYEWNASARWLNGTKLSNKYKEKIKKEAEKCCVEEGCCYFTMPLTNNRMTYLSPFHFAANSMQSTPMPSNKESPMINPTNTELKKECKNMDFIDLISDSLSDHSNVMDETEEIISASPSIQRGDKQGGFAGVGYCIVCQKQCKNARGLAIHKKKVHHKSNTKLNEPAQTRKSKRKQANVSDEESPRKKRKLSYSDISSNEDESSVHSISSSENSNDSSASAVDNEAPNDGQYEVCRILSKKWIPAEDGGNALVFYLIEWAGYELNQSTWEQDHALNCPKKLKKFEKSIKYLDECDKCKVGGYDCCTLPCFKHHCKKHDYNHIFCDFLKPEIKQIAQIEISRAAVESYGEMCKFDFDIPY